MKGPVYSQGRGKQGNPGGYRSCQRHGRTLLVGPSWILIEAGYSLQPAQEGVGKLG